MIRPGGKVAVRGTNVKVGVDFIVQSTVNRGLVGIDDVRADIVARAVDDSEQLSSG